VLLTLKLLYENKLNSTRRRSEVGLDKDSQESSEETSISDSDSEVSDNVHSTEKSIVGRMFNRPLLTKFSLVGLSDITD